MQIGQVDFSMLLDKMVFSMNPITLLCSRQVQCLEIFDLGRGDAWQRVECKTSEKTRIECVPSSINLPHDWTLEGVESWESELKLTACGASIEGLVSPFFSKCLPWHWQPGSTANASFKFIVFEAEIEFPKVEVICSKRRAKEKAAKTTSIRVVFPHPDFLLQQSESGSAELQWPVCSTLPVCHVGLPFILQADWDVVTSRENLLYSSWNERIRDCFVQLLKVAFQNSITLQQNLGKYLVSIGLDGEGRRFWGQLEKDVTAVIKGMLRADSLLLANPEIDDTLGIMDGHLALCLQKTVHPVVDTRTNQRNEISDENRALLRRCVEVVQIEDILACFPEYGEYREFAPWANVARKESAEWWLHFFELLSDRAVLPQKEHLLSVARSKPLFSKNQAVFPCHNLMNVYLATDGFSRLGSADSTGSSGGLVRIASTFSDNTPRVHIAWEKNPAVFLCDVDDEPQFPNWRPDLVFISSRFPSEKRYDSRQIKRSLVFLLFGSERKLMRGIIFYFLRSETRL